MKHFNLLYFVLFLLTTTLFLSSCSKSDIGEYTPDYQKNILNFNWINTDSRIEKPKTLAVKIGDDKFESANNESYTLPKLSDEIHSLMVYNEVENITIDNKIATALVKDDIVCDLDWFFSSYIYSLVGIKFEPFLEAKMIQQLGQINFYIKTKGSHLDKIDHISAHLSGISHQVDMNINQNMGKSVAIEPILVKHYNTYSGSHRIMGIHPTNNQTMTLNVHFTNGLMQSFSSDISILLAGVNYTKTTPRNISTEVTLAQNSEGKIEIHIADWMNLLVVDSNK